MCSYGCIYNFSKYTTLLTLLLIFIISIKIEGFPNMDLYEYIKFVGVGFIIGFIIYLYYSLRNNNNNNNIIVPEEIIIVNNN